MPLDGQQPPDDRLIAELGIAQDNHPPVIPQVGIDLVQQGPMGLAFEVAFLALARFPGQG